MRWLVARSADFAATVGVMATLVFVILGVATLGVAIWDVRPAAAQPLDLSQGGPITVTARDGLEWHQSEHEVIALGDAHAVRGNVTVVADRLIAYYRKKADAGTAASGAAAGAAAAAASPAVQPAAAHNTSTQPGATQPGANQPGTTQPGATQLGAGAPGDAASDTDAAGTEIYRLRAEGNVQIFTATDHAQGDVAVYDIDQAVLVMTGHDLKLTTPNEVLTARDTMEYWPQKHMAVARGDAVVVTKDARRVAADVLVAYTTSDQPQPGAGAQTTAKAAPKPNPSPSPPGTPGATPPTSDDLAASGKIEKVEAFGHVSVRTPTDTAIGDRAVYVPETGIARLADHVRITRGQNQLDGHEAEVNMKTGIARFLPGQGVRVTGLVVPNDQANRDLTDPSKTLGGGPPGGPPPLPAGAAAVPSTGTNSAVNPTGGHK
jgi:lipopolysaccharide export system protein LptA